ncbi:Methylated-DNA-protein-cysteine S-methyltransferase-like protein [Xanthomonas citri pv. bilvae]|nr:Methylated-DNA-protein-cysteine S-methyltransferase-like protein [Xanthomonas citri pv. bilvae]
MRTRTPLSWHACAMSKSRHLASRPSTSPAARAGSKGKSLSGEQARLRIVQIIRTIPAGEVAGYGEVARRAGLPGRARLVARVLSGNDDPKLPWHRVLRSDGRIALPEGSAGYREQCQRLRAEGVQVERGRVRRASAAQRLDAAVWGPS